jgi:hypothetical protein
VALHDYRIIARNCHISLRELGEIWLLPLSGRATVLRKT